MNEPFNRARECLGVRFRPLGRKPEFGLDCVGLAAWAYQLSDAELPTYQLGEGSWQVIEEWLLQRLNFVSCLKHKYDALLVISFPACFHLGVCGERTIIHADMRLKRVVETPLGWVGESASRYYSRGGS